MLKLSHEKKRMAIIKTTGGGEIIISRSRADGSTVGIKAWGVTNFKTLNVEELMMGLLYVTHTDAQLEEMKNGNQVAVPLSEPSHSALDDTPPAPIPF